MRCQVSQQNTAGNRCFRARNKRKSRLSFLSLLLRGRKPFLRSTTWGGVAGGWGCVRITPLDMGPGDPPLETAFGQKTAGKGFLVRDPGPAPASCKETEAPLVTPVVWETLGKPGGAPAHPIAPLTPAFGTQRPEGFTRRLWQEMTLTPFTSGPEAGDSTQPTK